MKNEQPKLISAKTIAPVAKDCNCILQRIANNNCGIACRNELINRVTVLGVFFPYMVVHGMFKIATVLAIAQAVHDWSA